MITRQFLQENATQKEWEAGVRLAQASRVRVLRTQQDWATYMMSDAPHWQVTLRVPDGSSCECGKQHCRHLVAAVLVAERTGVVSELLNGQNMMSSQALFNAMESAIPPKESLKLEVTLSGGPQNLSLRLRTGETRLYVVRSIPAFLRALREERPITFSRNFTLIPQQMRYTREQMALLNLLDNYLNTLGSVDREVRPEDQRDLPLPQHLVEQVLDALRRLPFILETDGEVYQQEGIGQYPLPVVFDVDGGPAALQISTAWSADIPVFGQSGAYALLDGQLVHLQSEERRLLQLLNAFCTDGTATFVFGRQDVPRVMAELLPSLMREHAVNIQPGLRAQMISLPLVARVYLDAERGEIVARVMFVYGEYQTDPFTLKDDIPVLLMRDALAERRVMDALARAGFRVLRGHIHMDGDEEIFEFITHGVAELSRLAEVFMSQAFRKLEPRAIRLSGSLRSRNGRVSLELFDDGTPVEELLPLMQAIREGRQYFRYREGTFVYLEGMEDWIDLARAVEEAAHREPDTRDLQGYHASYLQALASAHNLPIDAESDALATPQRPDSPVEGLHPYQLDGFHWLCSLHALGMGGILADEMGLGKTVQTIAAISHAVRTGPDRMPSLVVVPTTLIYNWVNEFARFAPELKVVPAVGTPAERDALVAGMAAGDDIDVMLTSYPLLRQDVDQLAQVPFRFVVLDEAQNIKNMDSMGARAAKRLQAHTRLALSGTPMENSIGELWSLFDFVLPGYLPPLHAFLKRYDQGREAEDLLLRIRPFMMRRLKKDVMEQLPPKIETTITVDMPPEQRKVYSAALMQRRLHVMDLLRERGLSASRIQVLALITQLRQICCHPALVMSNYVGASGKLDVLMDILPQMLHDGHRVLIFSQFTAMLALIRQRLNQEGIAHLYLDGDTPARERQALSQRFNEGGEEAVFLISLKAGGTGLNLTGADTVIHYDPWWNPAAEDQAADRAHRLGQQNTVQVLKLVMHDSIEEQVVTMGRRKRRLFDLLITPGEQMPDKLTEQDVLMLFGQE